MDLIEEIKGRKNNEGFLKNAKIKNWTEPFSYYWKHWSLLKEATKITLKGACAGSLFGYYWIILNPLLLIGLYSLIYCFITRVSLREMSIESYITHIFLGIIPYLTFSQVIQQSVICLVNNPSIIFSTLFPSEIFVAKMVLSNSVTLFIGLCVLLLYCVVYDVSCLPGFFFCILLSIFFLLFVLGISLVLALIGIAFKDLKFVLSHMMVIILMLSPIGIAATQIPPKFKFVAYFNPLYIFLVNYQKILLPNSVLFDLNFVVAVLVSLMVFFIGFKSFKKFKRTYFDYL